MASRDLIQCLDLIVLCHETLNLIIVRYLNADLPVADEPLAALADKASHLVDAIRVHRAIVCHLRALVHIATSPAILKIKSAGFESIMSSHDLTQRDRAETPPFRSRGCTRTPRRSRPPWPRSSCRRCNSSPSRGW